MLELILIPALLLGIYICYQDIRHGKISNVLVIFLLLLGIAYQAFSGTIMTETLAVASTFLYGFLISFLLWWLGLWPGGDAKLFIVMLLLLPSGLYSGSIILPYLANTFIPVFVFMTFYALFRSRAPYIKKAVSYSLNPYRISFIFIILIGFMWFFTGIIKLAGIQADYFMTILLLFAVYELFSITLSAKAEAFFILLAVLRVLLDFQGLFTMASLQFFLLVAGTFIFFRFFLIHLTYYTLTSEIRIEKLVPGMVLAEGIYPKGKGYAKESLLNPSLIDFIQQKKIRFIHGLDELTERDTERIKRLRKQGRIGFATVRICQTQPFAVFILIGYILTLLFQGGIFHI